MNSSKNAKLFIDYEALVALSLLKNGLLHPATKLMTQKEAKEVEKTKLINGQTFPFSLILAPSGKRNKEVLQKAKKNTLLDLVYEKKKIGELTVEEVFPINPLDRIEQIFATRDTSTNPNVERIFKRLGEFAVSGEYTLERDEIKTQYEAVQKQIAHINAKNIVGITMHSKPMHRVHERIMRTALEKNDMVILFLLQNLHEDDKLYELKKESVQEVVANYFPQNHIMVVPLINTYISSGINEAIIDAILIKNFGCNKFLVGQTHKGLGIYYHKDHIKSIFDNIKGLHLKVDTINEYVYCNLCRTLVSTNSCPHGAHHHIRYEANYILELLKTGIMPPPILMRKEISARYLTTFFPKRFEKLQTLYYDILPNKGLIEEGSEEDFYISLMELYQTSSLT